MTHLNLSILVRQKDHGYSQSIVDGIREAGMNSDIFIVIGFFAVRKDIVLDAPLKLKGYKNLLEILGK